MTTTALLAKQLRDVHTGGNWTSVNLKDTLAGVTWEQATAKVHSLNTIVALVYHINYYVIAIQGVLKGQSLTAKDKFSFDHPPVQSEDDWTQILNKTWAEVNTLALLIEQLPDSRLPEIFCDEKYGTYHRNIMGLIEHTHYHLGQIAIIKKILLSNGS